MTFKQKNSTLPKNGKSIWDKYNRNLEIETPEDAVVVSTGQRARELIEKARLRELGWSSQIYSVIWSHRAR
jgi:hypothetical protein